MQHNLTVINDLPENWATWQVTAAVERAYGKSYTQIGEQVDKCRQTVANFLADSTAQSYMLRLRREAASVIYGRSLQMAAKAMDDLESLLGQEDLAPDARLKAIDLVRKIIGDATKADTGAAYRALIQKLQKSKGR